MAAVLSPSTIPASPSPSAPSHSQRLPSPAKANLPPLVTSPSPPSPARLSDNIERTPDSRYSTYSRSRSRQTSAAFPLFHSSLSFAMVRDFAYPAFHPVHYGPLVGTLNHSSECWDSGTGRWKATSWADSHSPQLSSTSPASGETDSDEDVEGAEPRENRFSAKIDAHSRGRKRTAGGRNMKEEYAQPGLNSAGFFTSGNIAGQDDADDTAANGEIYYAGPHSPTDFSDYSPTISKSVARQDDADDTNANGDIFYAAPYSSTDYSSTLPNSVYYHDNSHDPADSPDSRELLGASQQSQHPPFREDTPDEHDFGHEQQSQPDSIPLDDALDETFVGPSVALYDFVPENDVELALREGQIILVSYRHGQGWLEAHHMEEDESGLIPHGLIPEEYVRLLSELEGWEEEEACEDASLSQGTEGLAIAETKQVDELEKAME